MNWEFQALLHLYTATASDRHIVLAAFTNFTARSVETSAYLVWIKNPSKLLKLNYSWTISRSCTLHRLRKRGRPFCRTTFSPSFQPNSSATWVDIIREGSTRSSKRWTRIIWTRFWVSRYIIQIMTNEDNDSCQVALDCCFYKGRRG